MRKVAILALCVLVFTGLALAQTYSEGTGITGIDKLGAHQNGGRGCAGCHTPHSGAFGTGGNEVGGITTDPNTGNVALWGQDLQPLYGKTLVFGGETDLELPADSVTEPELTLGVMMCLSCHDGDVAKGAMMTNESFEQKFGLLPAGYGPNTIPTLLGDDGTAAGNYKNDHPIGPNATLGAVRVASRLVLKTAADQVCGTAPDYVACLVPKDTDTQFMAFYNNYGAFNITRKVTSLGFYAGGRTSGVVIPAGATTPNSAYLVCTTCHTPHSMYTFSGNPRNQADWDSNQTGDQSGVFPTYFFVYAPYNPGADTAGGTKASSATQFCRQCHFTGAGGSNEGSNIFGIGTAF